LRSRGRTAAYAQQAGRDLNEVQRLGRQVFAQSCGICHCNRRRGENLRAVAEQGSGRRQRRGHARVHRQRHDRMPAFKYYLKPARSMQSSLM